jgi:mannose PTS system EIIA component
MIGILIIAHGTLGESLIHCASHVLNKRPPRLRQLGVTAQDDPLLLLPQARALVKELDTGSGVLILSDMYGGSPSNIAAKLLVPGRIEGVAGVNLPMLIRALTYREKPLAALLTKAISGGCEGVLRIPPLALHNAATGS